MATDPRTPYTQSFFIGGRYLGETKRKVQFYHEEKGPPLSVCWVCRICGEVYAKAPVVDLLGKESEYNVVRRLCPRHPTQNMWEVAGSLWMSWDQEFLDALPVPVLQYEMERHILAIETLEGIKI